MAVDHASAANFGFARLVGHAFGCETDARAASRSPVDVYAYGSLHIAEPPFFRTIMGSAAGCPAGSGCPLLPYFSAARNESVSISAAVVPCPSCPSPTLPLRLFREPRAPPRRANMIPRSICPAPC